MSAWSDLLASLNPKLWWSYTARSGGSLNEFADESGNSKTGIIVGQGSGGNIVDVGSLLTYDDPGAHAVDLAGTAIREPFQVSGDPAFASAPAFTVAGWFRPFTLAGNPILFALDRDGQSDALRWRAYLDTASGRLVVIYYYNGTSLEAYAPLASAFTAAPGTTYFIALRLSGGVLRFYVNGQPVDAGHTVLGSGLITPTNTFFTIGAIAQFGSSAFVSSAFYGIVDESFYIDTGLSSATILALYEAATTAPAVGPGAPTGLTADPAEVAAVITWSAPAAGGPLTGYDLRVDGGPPLSVGNVTTYDLTGLSPATAYAVEVRSVGPGGVSAWVPVLFSTGTLADYRVMVRLGVHEWFTDAGDPPELGPILPLSFGWSVPDDSLGFPAQPDPDLANVELVTADYADMAGVDIGTTMRVSFYVPGLARPLATFRGRVADLEASPHAMGLSWRVLGVGYTADPGTRQVGTGDWPEESGDARAARVMAEAGFPGWTADPIGTTWESRTPGATTARAELERLAAHAVTNASNIYDPARRVLVHPLTDAYGDPLPGSPFAGTEVVRRTDALDFLSAGLVNRATTWRRTKLLDASWVKIDHPGGPTTYGDTRGPAYPPQSVSITDPTELADLLLDTTPGYRWLSGQPYRLELWADDGPGLAVVSQWSYRDPDSEPFPWSGRAVIVQGIQRTPDGATDHAGMLGAVTYRLEHVKGAGGRLLVDFRLRPEIPAASTVTVRWMDEDPALTWADEPDPDYPGPDWYALRTHPRP